MDYAIDQFYDLERRVCARLLDLDRAVDGDHDVLSYRAAIDHDEVKAQLVDVAIERSTRLAKIERAIDNGGALKQVDNDFLVLCQRKHAKNGSVWSRCVNIRDKGLKNQEKQAVEMRARWAEDARQDRRYRAQQRNAAIKTFAVRTVIVVGVGTVVTAGVVLLAAGLGMMLGHAAIDGSTRRRY